MLISPLITISSQGEIESFDRNVQDKDSQLKRHQAQSETIELVAQTPGTYSLKCCVHCGLGHMGMKGELVVDP